MRNKGKTLQGFICGHVGMLLPKGFIRVVEIGAGNVLHNDKKCPHCEHSL